MTTTNKGCTWCGHPLDSYGYCWHGCGLPNRRSLTAEPTSDSVRLDNRSASSKDIHGGATVTGARDNGGDTCGLSSAPRRPWRPHHPLPLIVGLLALLPTLANAQMVPPPEPRTAAPIETVTPPSLLRFRESEVRREQLIPLIRPPMYAAIWAEAVACSGRATPAVPYERVTFQLVDISRGFLVHGRGPFVGYTFTQPGDTSAEIWLMKGWEWNYRLVKHEMLHAILGHDQQPVHPVDVGLACGVW